MKWVARSLPARSCPRRRRGATAGTLTRLLTLALLAVALLVVGNPSPAAAQVDLDTSVHQVSPGWPLLPEGLKTGDKFRVVFISRDARNATTRNQEDYHDWVRTQAGTASLPAAGRYNAYVCGKLPLGGSSHHLAIHLDMVVRNNQNTDSDAESLHNPKTMNTYADGVIHAISEAPVYWLNGRKAYDNAVDLLNSYGPRTVERESFHTDEYGAKKTAQNVWTGCLNGKLGSLETDLGSTNASARNPESGVTNQRPAANRYSVYGVSPIYQVGAYQKQMAVQHTSTGSPTSPLMLNAEGSYTVGIKNAAGQPPDDITVTATVVNGNTSFKTKDNVRLSDSPGTTYANAAESVTVTIPRASWQTAKTIYVVPKPGGRTYSGLFFIEHAFDGGVTDIYWHRFGAKYHRVKGRVKASFNGGSDRMSDSPQTMSEPEPEPQILQQPTQLPQVSIAAGAGITEGGSAQFTLTASPAPAAPLDVTVDVTQSGNFAAIGRRTVTLPAAGAVTFTVATIDDGTDEADGSVSATLQAGSGYSVGSAGSATVAVADNDAPSPTPELSITGGGALSEGGDAVFTISANPAATATLTVNLSVSQQGDFAVSLPATVTLTGAAATLRISTVDDGSDEADGSLTVALAAGSGYRVSGGYGAATVSVADDDVPALSIAAGGGIAEGGQAFFTVTARPPPYQALTLPVTIADSGAFAASGQAGSRTFTLPVSGSVSFSVGTDDDSVDEPDGTLTATLAAGWGYTLAVATASVAVSDDDAAPDTLSNDTALETEIQKRIDKTDANGDAHSNRIWRGALAAVRGEDPPSGAREVDAAFAQRLADNHRSGGRTELADLWQEIADALSS